MSGLSDILEAGEAQRLATGFTFTEGPLYHPEGFYYFVDVRESKFYRIKPGSPAELLSQAILTSQPPRPPGRPMRARPSADRPTGNRAPAG